LGGVEGAAVDWCRQRDCLFAADPTRDLQFDIADHHSYNRGSADIFQTYQRLPRRFRREIGGLTRTIPRKAATRSGITSIRKGVFEEFVRTFKPNLLPHTIASHDWICFYATY